MQQYNVFQALYLAFYSKDLYRDVAQQWHKKAWWYLLMLVALSWILSSFQIQKHIDNIYEEQSSKIASQIPLLIIKNGKLNTPENRPYIVINPNTNDKLVIIDVTGKYNTLVDAKSSVLVTQNQIMIQKSQNVISVYQIPTALTTTINPLAINSYITNSLSFFWAFILIFAIIFSYIYRIFQALIYSLIGKIFTRAPVSYRQIMQITMVAMTPTIILSTMCDYFSVTFSYQWLSYFALSMFYLFYGLAANKSK